MSEKKYILEVDELGINFGGLRAVNNFSMKIEEGQLYGLIGPNGAGKTTVFNMLTGVYTPTDGTVKLEGKKINGMKPYAITRLGIARTFQNIRLFKDMTVKENVLVALDTQASYGLFSGMFKLPNSLKQEKDMDQEAMSLLEVFRLEKDADKLAKNLPYGKQRELEIIRALGAHPKLLLLDEPAAGMNPQETKNLMETIRLVRDRFNIAILLIEHDMKLVMGICEKISVLNYGMLLAEGTPEEIRINPDVVKAYLGE
ncbi:ABC transporter ATP-binding protein [Solobacterium moorei]|uniref:ABC transporter ATP-binding protein n=1 Tax=Solobacterium moorei TaxID=102148 RepID=UPI00040B19FA|nr:ABC transporter ATP-binding protein [Solobacterium moorei]BET22718.1 ABC transporter ATP-binding protein [Solobacterium moorei]